MMCEIGPESKVHNSEVINSSEVAVSDVSYKSSFLAQFRRSLTPNYKCAKLGQNRRSIIQKWLT